MKRYEKYKNSGVEWIGEVPAHWERQMFKNFVSLKSNPSFSSNKIGLENIESGTGKFCATGSIFEGNGISFEKGDIVYGKLRPYLMKVWEAEFGGNAVGDFYVFSSTNKSHSTYLKYVMLSEGFTQIVNGSTYGAKMPRVASQFILSLPYELPPLKEQQAIASYLDSQCSKIDEMIEAKSKQIDDLKDYRKSLISEVVTKGLNPNVEMKESGVEWLGIIPLSWSIKPLKALFKLNTGSTPKAFEDIIEGDQLVNWYTPSDVKDEGNCLYESGRFLSARVIKEDKIALNPVGTIYFVGIGATAGKVGYALYPGYSNQQLTALLPKEGIFSKYFFYYLSAARKRVQDNALYTTLPIINNAYLSKVQIPVPSIEEQQAIAEYLDDKCSKIADLMKMLGDEIEELKKYKTSIISEAVTGKIKVC